MIVDKKYELMQVTTAVHKNDLYASRKVIRRRKISMRTAIQPAVIPAASSPASALVQKPRTSAGKKAARNLIWPDHVGRITSIMIGGTVIPTRNGAVSRSNSI